MTTVQARADYPLVAHLLRRAGFGGTSEELHDLASVDYEVAVDRLLDAVDTTSLPDDLIRRYHIDQSDLRTLPSAGSYWIGRMVTTDAPFVEKVALFWHRVFATGYAKLAQGRVLSDQIDMFRTHGVGSLRTLLVELSRDPSMIIWLDNHDNHKGAINENYARELLELFSMGVGNYTEADIREAARAFTGWGNDDLTFVIDPDKHDDGEKRFLGQTGNFDGDDILRIILDQDQTALYIASKIYRFFVRDDLSPAMAANLGALLCKHDYALKPFLRTLFLSQDFYSPASVATTPNRIENGTTMNMKGAP